MIKAGRCRVSGGSTELVVATTRRRRRKRAGTTGWNLVGVAVFAAAMVVRTTVPDSLGRDPLVQHPVDSALYQATVVVHTVSR